MSDSFDASQLNSASSVPDSGPQGKPADGMRAEHRNPISIAMMFYLLTLAGIVAASIGRISQQEVSSKNLVVASIAGGCFLGLVLGFCSGSLYHRSVKAALVGSVVGTIIGAVAGALTIIHHEHFVQTMSTAFLGCWLILCTMLVAARWQVR